MKILKSLGLVLLGLIVLILIAGAILPTHFEKEGSTEINASKEAVFSTINDITTWQEWGPWSEDDPSMEVTYGEITEGEGASYSWTSEELGNGKMTVTEVDPPTLQLSKLEFEGMGESESWMKIADGENDATKVTWGFSYDIPYPFNTFALFSSDEEVNDMFQRGLSNLKRMVEEKPDMAQDNFQVKEVDFPGKTYLAIRDKVKTNGDDIAAFYADKYGFIMGAMTPNNIPMDGHPTGIYYDWNEETGIADMAAAIPVEDGQAAVGGDIQLINVPAGKGLLIDYYGAYDDIGNAHYAMDDYMKAQKLAYKGPVLEVYVTDPGAEPDTAKWLTKIYYFHEGPVAEGD